MLNEDKCCLCEKLETNIKIKTPPDQFFSFVAAKQYLYPEVAPSIFEEVTLLEGEWGKEGIVQLQRTTNGRINVAVVPVIDYNKLYLVSEAIDGSDLLDIYKSFKSTLLCIPKCDGTMARWTLIYEKYDERDPEPIETYENYVTFTQLVAEYLPKKA